MMKLMKFNGLHLANVPKVWDNGMFISTIYSVRIGYNKIKKIQKIYDHKQLENVMSLPLLTMVLKVLMERIQVVKMSPYQQHH